MIALLTATLTVSHSIVALQPSFSTPVASSLPASNSIASLSQQHEPPAFSTALPQFPTASFPPSTTQLQPAAVVIPAQPVVTPVPLQKRQGIWREPYTTSYDKPGCRPITLSPGTFHFGDTTIVIPAPAASATAAPIVFHPLCLHGRPVLGIASHNSTELPSVVPNAETEWKNWIADGGRFATSVVPLMYSIAASSAMCWLLTFIIMGFQTRRPVLYRLSLLCCSIYLLIVLINFTTILNNQFDRGYLDAIEARHIVKLKPKLHGLNLAFNTIIYLAQVQVAMSLFSRQKEKRMVLWLGGSVSIVAQTIYGISVFHPMSMMTSLSTFAYLFQIALGVLYSCCVFYYAITNWQSALTRDPSMLFLTVLALLAAMSPIILFIVDLVNLWVFEWADALSWATSLLAIVTVREWADRVYVSEKIREKNGVLGRQVFEDETGPAAIRPTAKPRRPSTDNNGNDNEILANRGRPWDEESELTGSTYHQHSASTATHRPSPLLHHNQRSPSPQQTHTRMPVSLPGPFITHAIIDSPFDPYEDKSIFFQYFHKALDSIVFISDIVINLGMSVSRPLSFSSSHNNNRQTVGARAANMPESTTENAVLEASGSNDNNNNNNNNNNNSTSRLSTANIANTVTIVTTHNSASTAGSMQQQPLQQFHYAQKRVVRSNNNNNNNNMPNNNTDNPRH